MNRSTLADKCGLARKRDMKNSTDKDYVTSDSFAMKIVRYSGNEDHASKRLDKWYGGE